MMTTAPCPVCTANVPQVDGNLILHRHRDRLGPCPAGQVPDPGVDVDEGEALAEAEATVRDELIDGNLGAVDHSLPVVMREYDRRAVRIEELEAERDEALTAKLWALRAVGSASVRLAVVGPVLDAARALVDKGRLPSDTETYRLWATLDDAITAHDRELEEGT